MLCKVGDETIYPFPNFTGATVELWELINNSIPSFMIDEVTYPCEIDSPVNPLTYPCYSEKSMVTSIVVLY